MTEITVYLQPIVEQFSLLSVLLPTFESIPVDTSIHTPDAGDEAAPNDQQNPDPMVSTSQWIVGKVLVRMTLV